MDSIVSSADSIDQVKIEFSSYSKELTDEWKLPRMILSISDPSLRYSLYSCYSTAQENQIRFDLSLSRMVPSFTLSPYQLVRVIDNLFQNAVDYNMTLDPDKRYILLELTADLAIKRLTITNPFYDQNLTISDMLSFGKTTKGKEHQGLGLPGVEKILKENGIDFYGAISWEKECITFVCEEPVKGEDEK